MLRVLARLAVVRSALRRARRRAAERADCRAAPRGLSAPASLAVLAARGYVVPEPEPGFRRWCWGRVCGRAAATALTPPQEEELGAF